MKRPRHPHGTAIGRRTFLIGAAATGALAACSGDDSSNGGGDDVGEKNGDENGGRAVAAAYAGESRDLAADSFLIIQRFPVNQATFVPGPVRLPVSLAGDDADFITDGPLRLGGQVVDRDGKPVGARLEAVRRDVSPSSYYAFEAQVDVAGIYAMVVDGGPDSGANFQVFEPDEVTVPRSGQVLPGFDTPTVDDMGGVEPICTRQPACPFHSMTLTDALNAGKAVAYLVGTPALCQTGSCTPALEALVEAAPDYEDDFVFVHAEVWTDDTATAPAPAVSALTLDFEPTIFITDAAGTIIDRLDAVWDSTELREKLDIARA